MWWWVVGLPPAADYRLDPSSLSPDGPSSACSGDSGTKFLPTNKRRNVGVSEVKKEENEQIYTYNERSIHCIE